MALETKISNASFSVSLLCIVKVHSTYIIKHNLQQTYIIWLFKLLDNTTKYSNGVVQNMIVFALINNDATETVTLTKISDYNLYYWFEKLNINTLNPSRQKESGRY